MNLFLKNQVTKEVELESEIRTYKEIFWFR